MAAGWAGGVGHTNNSGSRKGVDIKFVIRAWAAWSPGLQDSAQWLAWAARPAVGLPGGGPADPSAMAPAAEMSSLARRRLSPLGRSAAQVIYQLAADAAPGQSGLPMLLASRYGDAVRSLALLEGIARGEPASPTAFSLSVHNAIGAVVAIARGDRAPQTAIAGGACSAGHALIEAAGWFADGSPELILVCYDEPLPGEYGVFHDEATTAYAWAWRIAAARLGEAGINLNVSPQASPAATDSADDMPFGLALMRFVLAGQRDWLRVQEGQRWRCRLDD